MERIVIGIDEVGRGPLAGPVAVGICAIEEGKYAELLASELFWKGKDSKKLTEKRRKASFEKMKELKAEGILAYGVFFESNAVIDKFGIAAAIRVAIGKGLKSLACDPAAARVLLDGGLKAPAEYADQQSIVRGDESELAISLASIAAKVTRDAKMGALAEAIPHYDLASNKGYGTAKHIADLRRYGPCELHRRSFIRRLLT